MHSTIAIIGAGPCGLAVGIAAARAGVSAVLFDRGCVASSISRYPTWMTFFSTADRLEIGGVPFIVTDDKPTRREALRYYQRVATEFDMDVRQYTDVVSVRREGAGFVLATRSHVGEEREHRADNVVVATGYFDSPNLLGVPGEHLPHVAHNYREGHTFFRQRVLVTGGGNSAVDAALELYRWGAHVTIAHFQDALDPNVKPWVRPEIEARLREGVIEAQFGVRVAEIRPDSVVLVPSGFQASGGKVPPPLEEELAAPAHDAAGVGTDARAKAVVVPVDFVLAMTGYTPEGGLLRSLGVEYDPATGIPAHSPETMQTNVPGVYIAGVLSAGYDANKVFIENGRGHGALIVADVVARAG